MRTLLLCLSICSFHLLVAQINVPAPQIITPTNIIYLSPQGDDTNTGTINSPKKTFQSALAAFPFGTGNINNSQSYNEVVFLAGDYYPTQTLSQNASQFLLDQNGIKRYKNVSVRGIGNVIIHGDNAIDAGASTLLALMGSHILVKNITLKSSKYAGIKFLGGNKHATHILIDSVKVDDAKSHGCLFVLADTICARNCEIVNTCNENSDQVASNCQWGSALKTEFCRDITFEHNKVYRNWGEGINTSLSERIICQNNVAYDNYSVNFYLHSAAKGVWRNNLVYNEDSLFWRGCYNGTNRIAPGGISIANELTCTYACLSGGNNQNCGGKYHCCAFSAYDVIGYQTYPYRQTDSIFVYNNILLQADIGIWDAFSGFLNYGFIKDIFIENNTVIGIAGRNTTPKRPINISLGTAYVYAQNFVIKNNIFTKDTLLNPNKNGITVYIPNGTCNAIAPNNLISLSQNKWNTTKICNNTTINTATEQVNNSLPTYILPTQLNELIPNTQHAYWIQNAPQSSYITHDYFGVARSASSNVGAIELNSISSLSAFNSSPFFTLYPNPTKGYFTILSASNEIIFDLELFSIQGEKLKTWQRIKSNETVNIDDLPSGIYLLKMNGNHQQEMKRLILYK